MQHLDFTGQGLQDVGTSVCPFAKARGAYSAMLSQPWLSPLATPLKHCMDKIDGGLVGLRDAFRLAASMCFMLGFQIWLLLECKYKGWPWRMMALDSPVEAVRKKCSDDMYSQSDCCHDAGCTRKAKVLGRDRPGLLKHKGVRSTMRMWKRKARFCNMNTERLLSKITKSTPRHGYAERLCVNGFLAQVNARHVAAGGTDVNKITRTQFRRAGVPLRCCNRVHGKRRIKSAPNRHARFIAKRQRARDGRMPMAKYKVWLSKQMDCNGQVMRRFPRSTMRPNMPEPLGMICGEVLRQRRQYYLGS